MFRSTILLATITLAVAFPFLETRQDWDERIVGGSNAKNGDAPYQVSLRLADNPSFHFCGASIISTRWLLSTAHCTVGKEPSQILAVVGSVLNSPTGKTYRLSQVISHTKFSERNSQYDVSVLQVAEDIQLGPYVQIIGLHSQTVVPDGKLAVSSGWGQTAYNGSVPNNMQIIQLHIISTPDCIRGMGNNGAFFVTEQNICTSTRSGGGMCFLDKGNPLVVEGKQEGIASWSVGCVNGYPDVFARVSYFRDWIRQNSGV